MIICTDSCVNPFTCEEVNVCTWQVHGVGCAKHHNRESNCKKLDETWDNNLKIYAGIYCSKSSELSILFQQMSSKFTLHLSSVHDIVVENASPTRTGLEVSCKVLVKTRTLHDTFPAYPAANGDFSLAGNNNNTGCILLISLRSRWDLG